MMVTHLGEAAAADTALDEVGEQIDGAAGALGADARVVMRELVTDMLLPRLNVVPKHILDDAKLANVLDDPVLARVRPRLGACRSTGPSRTAAGSR